MNRTCPMIRDTDLQSILLPPNRLLHLVVCGETFEQNLDNYMTTGFVKWVVSTRTEFIHKMRASLQEVQSFFIRVIIRSVRLGRAFC